MKKHFLGHERTQHHEAFLPLLKQKTRSESPLEVKWKVGPLCCHEILSRPAEFVHKTWPYLLLSLTTPSSDAGPAINWHLLFGLETLRHHIIKYVCILGSNNKPILAPSVSFAVIFSFPWWLLFSVSQFLKHYSTLASSCSCNWLPQT